MVRKDSPLFGNLEPFSSRRFNTSAVCVISLFCLTNTALQSRVRVRSLGELEDVNAAVVDLAKVLIALFVLASMGARKECFVDLATDLEALVLNSCRL